ncbi:helix-turn-helix domain protein [Actinobacteria bacterium OK074]|nr:helix-turn-helix domain protein [Actinobacteria bacterium OK074]
MRAAARALSYDVAYLSRVINGRQQPSGQLASALDEFLGVDGELASLVTPKAPPPASDEQSGPDTDIEHMKTSAAHVLKHADRHGGDSVASTAVQVWKSAQRKLDAGDIPEEARNRYLAAVSESAEVAGWLLFDAGKFESARTAFLESHMLARHAGERKMEWFALDMLAMLDIERCHPGGAYRIAEELTSQNRVPPRVALLARIRRGRALAQMGDSRRALTDLNAARGGLQESLSPRDPSWAWWVDECELVGHSGYALLGLGEPGRAVEYFQSALQNATPRGVMLYKAGLLHGYVKIKAWREAQSELESIRPLLEEISSGRNRQALRGALRAIFEESSSPVSLTGFATDVIDRLRAFEAA